MPIQSKINCRYIVYVYIIIFFTVMDCLEDVKRGLAPRKKMKGVGVKSVLK